MSTKGIIRNTVFLWKAYAHLMGVSVIALGIGFGIVQCTSGSNAVIIATDVRVDPGALKIVYKGQLRYTYDLERVEACPAEVVTVYASRNVDGAPAVVTVRRPAYLMEIKAYNDVKVVNDLPPSVTPGFWCVATTLVSHCANRTQTDPISNFEFEVTAS